MKKVNFFFRFKNMSFYLSIIFCSIIVVGLVCILHLHESLKEKKIEISRLQLQESGFQTSYLTTRHSNYQFIPNSPSPKSQTIVALLEEKLDRLDVLSETTEIRLSTSDQKGNLEYESADITISSIIPQKISKLLLEIEQSPPYFRIVSCDVRSENQIDESGSYQLSFTVQKWYRHASPAE